MKRLSTALLVFILLVSVQAFSQATKWEFVKVFPDTSLSTPSGVHALAVDPDGKVWFSAYGSTDSVYEQSTGKYFRCRKIWVYNPDGTPTSLNGIKTLTTSGGVQDTFYYAVVGARADMEGNIVVASGTVGAADTYFKIDYKTGQGMIKVTPNPGLASRTLTAPAFTAANEMFNGNVFPGKPVKIFDGATFSEIGTAIPSDSGYSRSFEVSKDGNNIYWAGYTLNKVVIYHSDLGTIGPYVPNDSMAMGFQAESFCWNDKDGYLYISGGNPDTADYGPFLPGHLGNQWVGFDVATKEGKDTISWNWGAYNYGPFGSNSPRARALAFSPSGDTAYAACFNFSKATVQMFRRVPVSVSMLDPIMPETYTLSQNYPNPFNPSTQINFSVAKAGMTTVKVYDLLGREVATLVNENLKPGTYKTQFDASRYASGTYIYTLTSGGFQMSKKMVLVK